MVQCDSISGRGSCWSGYIAGYHYLCQYRQNDNQGPTAVV